MYRIPLENEQITKALTTPFAPVDFTDEEKEQIRENIGAGTGSGGGGRNLLDNPWFTVNQRGVTSWTGGYGVDRWKTHSVACSVSNNVVTLGANCYFRQLFENDLEIGEYTASVKTADGEIISGTATYDGSTVVFYNDSTLSIYYDISTKAFVINPSASISIKAVKLELGSVSTLANDTPPDYTTELLKCKRYFQRSEEAFVGYCDSTTRAIAIFNYPVEMRTNPTMSVAGSYYVTKSGYGMATTSITAQSVRTKYAMVNFYVSSGLTVGQCVLLSPNSAGTCYIDLSADL